MIQEEDQFDGTGSRKEIFQEMNLVNVFQEGDLPVMWSLMESPMFHGDTVHLRQTPEVKIQELQDRVYTAWIT